MLPFISAMMIGAYGALASAVAAGKTALSTIFPSSTTNVNTATYVDYVNAGTGLAVTTSITLAGGTDLLVLANASIQDNSSFSNAFTIGVNDGTTDYDLGRAINGNGLVLNAMGSLLITGLGAGTYTLTLRVKTTSPHTITSLCAATLIAMEVA